MKLSFEPLLPLGVIGLIGAALALADIGPLAVARGVGRGRRALVAVFSTLAISVALLPLLSPRLLRERTKKATVLVLVDSSRSMATEDADGLSRFDAAKEAARALERSVHGARFIARGFDSSVHALPASPEGTRSALGDALEQARGEAPAAIVLVSDGASTSGRDPVLAAREARAAGIAVHTVSVGSATRAPPPRIASVEIEAPDRVALSARATVHVSTEIEGLAGAPIEASLALDGRPIGSSPLEAAGPRARRDASFEVSLDAPGEHVLAATVRSGSHSARATRRIRAVACDLSVALIDAPARWEHRWLRRALEETPRLRTARVDLWSSEPDARGTEAALAAIAAADVVILGDVPRRVLPAGFGAALLRAVDEDGKGLLLLGGRNAFGAALELGLGPALPCEAGEDGSPVPRSFRPQETDAGRPFLARALGVGESEVRDALQRLPALGSFEPLGAARANASVLLESPGRRALLATARWGFGRTAVLATDETWRWAFAPEPAREAHGALFRELVRALAGPAAGLDLPVSLAVARERVVRGTRLEASVAVTSSACVLLRGTLEGNGASSERPCASGTTTLAFDAAAPGEWVLRVVALDARGRELGRDERTVTVLPDERAERVGEPADPGLLVRIADAGGGAAFAAADVTRGDARRVLASALDPARPVVRETRPLAQGASHVLVIALLLSATWGLRRGAGLR